MRKKQTKKSRAPKFRGHAAVKFDFRKVKIPELPPLPVHPSLSEPPAKSAGNLEHCIECVRSPETLKYLDKDPNVRGVGVAAGRSGDDKYDGQLTIGFIVYKKLPHTKISRGCLLPKRIDSSGGPLDVRVIELDGDIQPAQSRCPLMTTAVGACGGSRIANTIPTPLGPFGTFGGSWDALIGSGRRGLTNAHVAIGLELDNFIAGLPGSLGTLFQSPRGEEIFTNGFGAADNFRIMEIDTIHPILTPFSVFAATLPLVLPAGAFGFVLLDCAAGDIDYQAIPNPPPLPPAAAPPARFPRRGLVGGGRIGRANLYPIPGDQVWSPGGQQISFGGVLLTNVQLAIGFAPLVVIVDQILSVLNIFPGDSGSPLLSTSGNRYYGSRWAGIGPPASTRGGDRFSRTTLATPARLIMTAMDLELV